MSLLILEIAIIQRYEMQTGIKEEGSAFHFFAGAGGLFVDGVPSVKGMPSDGFFAAGVSALAGTAVAGADFSGGVLSGAAGCCALSSLEKKRALNRRAARPFRFLR